MQASKPLLWTALVFVVLPTLLPMLLTQTATARPLVNVDYLLLAAVYPWLSKRVFVLPFAVVLIADGLRIAAKMFYFQPGAFIASVVYLPALNLGFVVLVTAISIALLVMLAHLARSLLTQPPRPVFFSLMFGLLALGLLLVDAATTGNALMRRDTAAWETNIATSSAWSTLRSIGRELESHTSSGSIADGPAAAATDIIRRSIREGHVPRRLLVVLSESWGELTDATAARLILQPIHAREVSDKYEVTTGVVPFQGSTVPAEFRELCGVRTRAVSPRPEQVNSGDCLPYQLGLIGYETIAVHGFSGAFFNRRAWYPAAGFQRNVFSLELEAVAGKMPYCGSVFRGQCDRDVFEWLTQQFPDSGARQFLYWLTLTAHVPVTRQASTLNCADSQTTRRFATVCDLAGLNRVILDSVVAWAVSDSVQDTAIIVVGDHPPPLLSPAAKQAYDQTAVPYVVLWPKARVNSRRAAGP